MKNIFVILVSILLILVLLYFYNDREKIINKEYISNNINIQYPYFGISYIDNYIDSYIKGYISNYKDYLFIDYDYFNNNDKLYFTMYVYGVDNGVVKDSSKSYIVDIDRESISVLSLKNNNVNYDFYYNRVINKNKKMIALTFDDGPNYNTGKVLDILEKYGVKGTFFVLGCNIKGNEEIIKRMDSLGMEIGNHMYSHKLVSKLSRDGIINEIRKVDNLVFSVIGKKPTLIRPSYGSYNNKFKNIVDRPIISWNVDTLDWKYHNSKRIADKVFNKVRDGSVILMHDIYSASKNSLEIIIPRLIDEGYQFVTVTELLYYKRG